MNIDSNFDRIKDEIFDIMPDSIDLEQANEVIDQGAYEDDLTEND